MQVESIRVHHRICHFGVKRRHLAVAKLFILQVSTLMQGFNLSSSAVNCVVWPAISDKKFTSDCVFCLFVGMRDVLTARLMSLLACAKQLSFFTRSCGSPSAGL